MAGMETMDTLHDQLHFLNPSGVEIMPILSSLDLDQRALGPLRAVFAPYDRVGIVLDGLLSFLCRFRLRLLLLLFGSLRGGRQATVSFEVCRHQVRNRPYQTIGEFHENLILLFKGPRRIHGTRLAFEAGTLHLVVPPDVARHSFVLS